MLACKVCGGSSPLAGHVDFNRTCWDRLGPRVFPVSEDRVPYYACRCCGFIFTPYCDDWSGAEFTARIYNGDYEKADPDPGIANGIEATGSYRRGVFLANMLDGNQGAIRLLDFGAGGNPGRMGQGLIDQGFDVVSYDPFFGPGTALPAERFDVVYAVEVIEHCVDVKEAAARIGSRLADDGLLYLATKLHPYPTPPGILNSWYIAPRNGHISIFTLEALEILFAPVGIHLVETPLEILGFKGRPHFKNKFFG